MRLKINFRLLHKNQLLPLNYQYPLSAWIYQVLNRADKEFSNMLHEHGYKIESGKTFKLFTYTKFKFPQKTWKIVPNSDRMKIWSNSAVLTISFQLPEQTEKFVTGLFKKQKVFIGDKISGIDMEVESIEALKDVGIGICDDAEFGSCISVKMRAETAIVLGINVDGEENEQYVIPIHADYGRVFLQNLADKYIATGKSQIDINCLSFKIIKLYSKTNLQTIKAHTPAQTKVKGYYYEFELTAPKDIIEVGLNAGFGSMNALGFGFCELM